MPFIEVSWLAGRTLEQKAELVRRFTDAIVEVGPCRREDVEVLFHDVEHGDWWQNEQAVGRAPVD